MSDLQITILDATTLGEDIDLGVFGEFGEVEAFPITPHCFRHSFTTICFEAGIDAKTTAAYIGDTEQVTKDVYTELRRRHNATSAERVNAYLELRSAERAQAE